MSVETERARREGIWQALLLAAPDRVTGTSTLDAVGIRPANTGQGIFRDGEHTTVLAPEGVTLTLLDTGSIYADAFDDDAGEYHYPTTGRGSRDDNEINATKNANRFGLPVFVVLRGPTSKLREVRRAWVDRWDDKRRVFLLSFVAIAATVPAPVPAPFTLSTGMRPRRATSTLVRPGQARFRFAVLSRCEARCVACGLGVEILLEAAHLCGVEDGGTDDPRNGLALCRNHHRAFDPPAALFGIEPETNRFVARAGLSLTELGVTRYAVDASHAPHSAATEWAWSRFHS